MSRFRGISLIETELENATQKFGKFASLHEGIAIIRKEYLELEEKIFNHGTKEEWQQEAIQLGAMAVRLFIDCKNEVPK